MAEPQSPDADKKEKIGAALNNLETATGEILFHDKRLTPLVASMRQQLFALRALLGLERPH